MADNSKKLIEAFRAKDLHTGLALFKKMMAERLEAAMAVERKTTYINEDYNGWKNRQTWNVALWIGNDQGLYNMARECATSDTPYADFVDSIQGDGLAGMGSKTPDGVAWDDPALDIPALDEMMKELIAESVNEDAKVSKDEQGRPVYNNLKDGLKKLAKEDAKSHSAECIAANDNSAKEICICKK